MRKKRNTCIITLLTIVFTICITCAISQNKNNNFEGTQLAFYYTDGGNQVKTDTIPIGYILDTYTCSNENISVSWNDETNKLRLNATGAANCKIYLKQDLISFTIDNTEYDALRGMTWAQWVNSGFNNAMNLYSINSDNHIVSAIGTITLNSHLVNPNDLIRDESNYEELGYYILSATGLNNKYNLSINALTGEEDIVSDLYTAFESGNSFITTSYDCYTSNQCYEIGTDAIDYLIVYFDLYKINIADAEEIGGNITVDIIPETPDPNSLLIIDYDTGIAYIMEASSLGNYSDIELIIPQNIAQIIQDDDCYILTSDYYEQ